MENIRITQDYVMAEGMDSDSVTVSAAGSAETDAGVVGFSATFVCACEVEWESDYAPTYVPYGNRMVLFDRGEGGVESADVTDVDLEIDGWTDEDGEDISADDALRILGVGAESVEKAILSELKDCVAVEAERYAETHAEKPEPEDAR